MTETISRCLAALDRNNMQGIFVPCITDIRETVKGLLFEGATITAGGSVSLEECGVRELISENCYNFSDRSKSGITNDERLICFKEQVGSDFFFCSANALTENGELVNVDGFSNRVSGIAFGPKKVIVIVGKNKIVKNTDEGFLRVKTIAAPKNCVRLGLDNPCARLGHCISLEGCKNPPMTAGCDKNTRICVNYLVTAKQREKNRITVIICGEDLGY